MKTSPTFCPLPWVHLCTNPTGRLALCCEDTLESDYEGKRDYHIREGVQRYRQSAYMGWVRERMRSGQPLRECAVCYREERMGIASKRLHECGQWGSDVTEASGVAYADLKFGNLCNLGCVMCDPNSSSRLADEYLELNWEQSPPFQVGQMGVPVEETYRCDWNWPDDSGIWTWLDETIPQLRRIKLTGGEPFINPYALRCLDLALRLGRDDLCIQITTNAVCLDEELLRRLAGANVDLVVSLEGVGPANDFIRYPSRWERIADNIGKLRAAGLPVRINATFNLFNLFSLPELIDYSHAVLGTRLTILPVVRPDICVPAIAPVALKRSAQVRWEAWAKSSATPGAATYARQLTAHLQAAEPDALAFRRFRKYADALCAHRGMELHRYLPELTEALAAETE